jgi:hypothetical protein
MDPKNDSKPTLAATMIVEARDQGKLDALQDLIDEEGRSEDYDAEQVAMAIPDVFPGKTIDEAVKIMRENPAKFEAVLSAADKFERPSTEEKPKGEYADMDMNSAFDKMGDGMSEKDTLE